MPPTGLASHPDHDALLAAVVADPDADLPRLVYADYLEEAGDEADAARAEFIRLQCGIAERERTARVAEGEPEWERAAELADDYGHEWRRRMPLVKGVTWGFGGRGDLLASWRGFPKVGAESDAVLHKARTRLREIVPLDCAAVASVPELRNRVMFAQSKWLGRLRVVHLALSVKDHRLYYHQRAEVLGRLLDRPEARQWRGLVLTNVDPAVVWRVAECDNLSSLEWLRLVAWPGEPLDAQSLRSIFTPPQLPRLAWVEVRTRAGDLLPGQPEIDAAMARRRRH